MRPVTKPAPAELPRGVGDAWSPADRVETALLDTLGEYCSFCEMSIESRGWVQSKRAGPPQTTPRLGSWDDLLLACSYCYAARADASPVSTAGYLWPDVDATFTLTPASPFAYALTDVSVASGPSGGPGGPGVEASGTAKVALVKANPAAPDFKRAQATIDLYRLNTRWYDAATNTLTVPTEPQEFVDRRLALRTEAWARAESALAILRESAGERPSFVTALFRQAAMFAQAAGFWSVWMTAFWAQYPDPKVIEPLFVLTRTKRDYVISGYQSVDKKTAEARASGLPGRPQPPPPSGPWTIFTGTAVDRLAYP